MSDSSYIDAAAVARELLDGADVSYLSYGDAGREVQRVTLPDGRVATLTVVFDEDSGIGEWIGRNGQTESHYDDVFGMFTWRGGGDRRERPAGFDGRAMVLRPRDNGARIADPVWWQPPADVAAEHLPELERSVRAYLETGDWFHVGFMVTIEEGGTAALWGIDWGHDDPDGTHADYLRGTVAELLDEAGIGKASTAAIASWARDPLHAAARMACGEALEGEATARMERRVRLAWESMTDDGVGIEARFEYSRDAPPVSTFRLWGEFGESSALRSALSDTLESSGGAESSMELEDLMRSAYVACISDALAVMPWAVDEASDLDSGAN